MTRPKPRYAATPRILNAFEVAARLGKSETWFREHLPELVAEGFPPYDGRLKGWDSTAIEDWLDKRSGIAATATEQSAWIDALKETVHG
jgi:predicted DNA-binding transcriptional regulator AlpA